MTTNFEKIGRLTGILHITGKGLDPVVLSDADVRLSDGIAGDVHGHSPRRQVTVLFREGWEAACRALGVELPWTIRRANLFVDGMAVPPLGSLLQVGEAILMVRLETTPCYKMDDRHRGLLDALKPNMRGGVCCSVVREGKIRQGDRVSLR